MKLEVPYHSQFADVEDDSWKARACSITCLKMALDYARPHDIPSIDHLVQEGIAIGGYTDHGWDHKALALIAHNYGVPAYAEEFRSVRVDPTNRSFSSGPFEASMADYGLKKIADHLREGKVLIVSIRPGLSQGKSIHTVLLTGFEEEGGDLAGFYFHDPDAPEAPRNDQFLSLEDFRSYWRKMAIFIG